MKSTLSRLLRSARRSWLEDVLALAGGQVGVIDTAGQLVFGVPAGPGQHSAEIFCRGERLGEVVGAGADVVARLLGQRAEEEATLRALGGETLERYRELTLLYELADRLSTVVTAEDVARIVLEATHTALSATGVSLLLEERTGHLDALAAMGSCSAGTFPARGVVGRVLENGRPELLESPTEADVAGGAGGTVVLVAPLRTGERTFGVLVVSSAEAPTWTAGDLKIAAAIGSSAAAAIAHARLHREQLHLVSLRGRLAGFFSPRLLDAVRGALPAQGERRLVACYCDLSALTRTASSDVTADALERTISDARSALMRALLDHQAAVFLPREGAVLGLFASGAGFADRARQAVQAAVAATRARPEVLAAGVAIVKAAFGGAGETDGFLEDVNAAAALQASAAGQILIDSSVAADAGATEHGLSVGKAPAPGKTHEVSA